MNTLGKLIISGLGTGYLRPAPGTWGSAVVAAIFLLSAIALGGQAGPAINAILVVIIAISSVGCVAFGRAAEILYGRKDPSNCTIDEWAGQALSLLLLPVANDPRGWLIVCVTAFIAFRFFDIIKPPPARQLEKLPFGWGVLLDDLAAGVYANIASQLVLRLALPQWGISL